MGGRRRGEDGERRPGRALGLNPSRIEERVAHVRRSLSRMTQTGVSRVGRQSLRNHI
jgi:hypothetical protein